MENLFSETVKKLKINEIPEIFKSQGVKIYKPILMLENALIDSYNSSEEDIEDLGDIVTLINMSLENAICNASITDHEIGNLLKTRIHGKKKVKAKYRDVKYQNRQFFNSEMSNSQFSEFMEYIWRPSILSIKNLISQYRPNMVVIEKPN